MDDEIILDNEDFLYGSDDFLNQLCNEYKWSSLLDAADASPSEILADAAPILVPPISPQISFKSSPIDSSNDSGSDDELNNIGISSSIDWKIGVTDIKTEELKLEDVEKFLQIPDTKKISSQNEPSSIVRPPEHQGPVMAIENGIIKIESIKIEHNAANIVNNNSTLNNDKVTGNKSENPYFKVVNEHSSNNKRKNGVADKVPIIITPKTVPGILKKPSNVSISNGATIVFSPDNKKNGIIWPQNHLKGLVQNSAPIQIKVLPSRNNVVIKSPPLIAQCEPTNNVIPNGVAPKVELSKSPSPVEQFSSMTDAEIRAIKKHQRMIKNRESACQSRKKKKDYMTALEQQLIEAHQEIARLQLENRMLKDQLNTCGRAARKLPRLDPTAFIPRKNVAVIFAMIFMVSLNWNSLGWSNSSVSVPPATSSGSRHLLWDDNTSNTYSSSEENFDQPTNRSTYSSNCQNSTVMVDDIVNINRTESIRIAGELNRWIGRGKKLNWTYNGTKKRKHNDKIKEGILETYRLFNKLNLDNSFLEFATNRYQARNIRDRSRLRKLRRGHKDMDFHESNLIDYNRLYSKHLKDELKMFGEWSALVEALHRRDDTFYVVGVGTGEHLLLPAVTHNVTRPPKMALILPARTGNESVMSDHVTLMQIDCSVVNTTIVKLKSDALPESMRKVPDTPATKKEPLNPVQTDPLHNSSNILKASNKFTDNLYKPKLDRNVLNYLFNKLDSRGIDDNRTLGTAVLQDNNLKNNFQTAKV